MPSKRDVAGLIDGARHDSVTRKRLTKLKGGLTARYLYDKPLIHYLKEGEQPHYIFFAREKSPTFEGDAVPSWGKRAGDGMAMHMITDTRWVFVVGMKSEDEWFAIDFDDIIHVGCTIGTFSHTVEIEAQELSVEIPISNTHSGADVESAVDFIRDSISSEQTNHPFTISLDGGTPTLDHSYFSICRDCGTEDVMWYSRSDSQKLLKCESCSSAWRKRPAAEFWELYQLGDTSQMSLPKTMIQQVRSQDALLAKLIIPTQSSGMEYEPETWGLGEMVETPWENYVKRLIIHDDHVELKITHGDLTRTDDNQVDETIRVDFADISDIRRQNVEDGPGFSFQSSDDVYQFMLTRYGQTNSASTADAELILKVLNAAVNRYEASAGNTPDESEDADTPATTAAEEPDSETGSSDVTKRLTQLKELHDSGVITDEEFQDKKEELLEEL